MQLKKFIESQPEIFFLFSLWVYAFSLPISITLTNVSLFLLLLSAVSICLKRKEWKPIPFSFYILSGFFLRATMTMTLATGSLEFSHLKSFRKLWNFFPYFLIPLAGTLSEKNVYWILRTVAIISGLVVILGLMEFGFGVQHFFSGWFGFEKFFPEGRFIGFQSHPLHTGGLYTILFLLSLCILLFYERYTSGRMLEANGYGQGKKEKMVWFACLLLLGTGLFLSISRSYYLAAMAAFLVLLASHSWKTFLGGSAIALLLFGALALFNPYMLERVKSIVPSHLDESGRQRLYMWRAALQMVREHPVSGIGYKRWGEELPNYALRFPDWKMKDAAKSHAHNSYLTVAAETGLVGLGLLLLFWGALLTEQFKILLHSKKGTLSYCLTTSTLSSSFVLLLAAFFEHNLFTAINSLALFFLIGLSRASYPES